MRRPLTLALALAIPLAGCAQIPRSGAVTEGSRVDAPADSRGLEPVAEGPVAGASPHEIVSGLVSAMVSSEDEYAVAREFLTPGLAARWQPRRETLVYSGSPQVSLTSDAAGRREGSVTVRVVATVGADGRYRRVEPQRRRLAVTVSRTSGGAWRVARFPGLTLVAEGTFSFSHRSHEVFFLSQDGASLVPVQRYLANGDGLATRLAAAVLAGPPAADRAGYGNAVPAGTRLASPATVTTDGDTAVVALTSPARSASPSSRAALSAQLLATLRGVLPITAVRLTVDGGVLDAPAQPVPAETPAATDLPVLLRQGRLERFDGEDLTPVGRMPDLGAAAPDDVAQVAGGGRFALTGHLSTRLYLATPGRRLGPAVLTGTGLTAPSFDPIGWVYTSSSPSPGYVDAVSPDGQHRRLDAAWLRGRTVRSLRISPDGGFAAVVSAASAQGAGRLDVVPLRRDGTTPTGLVWSAADVRSLAGDDVRTAAWRSSAELAVATAAGAGTLEVDGPLDVAGDIRRVKRLAPGAGSGTGDLALTADRRLYEFSGNAWYRVNDATGVHSIAASG